MVAIADTVAMPDQSRSANDHGGGKDCWIEADLHSPARYKGMASQRLRRARCGRTRVDGSLGGLGGCRLRRAPACRVRGSGVPVREQGIKTGIDIEKLIAVRGILK